MLWIQIKPWTYRLSLWFIHFRLQLTQAWSTNFQPIKTRDTKTCAWNMSTPLPREWGCLSTCNTNLGGQLLLLWGVSTWKSFFLASEKVSFLNAEAWKNLIEICLYHSQQSLKKQNAKKTRLHRRQIGRMQGKVEKRNQDPAKFILYSSWKYVINSYNVIKEKQDL